MLAEHSGKPVNVLIDTLGGSLYIGLSISATLKENGKVSVHFVSLNASAVAIASLGLTHISISSQAMYHVHKCFMDLFSILQSVIGDNEWSSLNANICNIKALYADMRATIVEYAHGNSQW